MDATQLVIVALASETDPVQKYSSEKAPHLTLLYLGENKYTPEELTHITEFVEHAATLLPRFGLSVEKRGELGENKADVLFFNKNWSKSIVTFRNQLLQNPLISTAYHSTDQFPEWAPHLTMGFPDSPAKKDDREFPEFHWVNFDRLALWTGDSTGPTFELKTDDYGEIAMSQTDRGRAAVDDMLIHYGVKGMKWGVRRDDDSSDGSSAPQPRSSSDAKLADATAAKIQNGGTRTVSNTELQSLITRMNLERQYSSMAVQQQNSIDAGLRVTQRVLKAGKTAEDVRRFLETPTGQAVKRGLKGTLAVAKLAAAYATGGSPAAAGAAGTIAVRRMSNHYTNVG